jgi:polysaccharide biosynthesis protein PslE
MNSETSLTLRDLLVAIRRRPGRFTLILLAGLAATVLFWKLSPRKYGSEGQIFVQLGRTGLTLDPSAAARSVTVMDAPEREIRSVMEIIKSRGVLLQVAEEIGPEEILRSDFSFLTGWIGGLLPSGGRGEVDGLSASELERLKQLELAAKEISDNLKVYLEKNTSVISVYVKSHRSGLAQRIVNTLMERTREHHLQIHAASNSREFFAKEYADQSRQLDVAIEAQRSFRNENGYLSLESARLTLQGIIDRIEGQLVEVEVELANADSQATELTERLAALEEFVETPAGGLESLSTEGARARYFDLQNERARLLAQYDEEHYRIREIDRQLQEISGELEKLPKQRTQTSAVINPVYEKIQTELVSLQGRQSGLKQKRESLLEKQAAAKDQLTELNNEELVSSQLQRQIDIARSHLAIYSQKLGEAKVLDQLDQQALSAVVISQPAVYMVKHVSPKGSIVLPAGALLSGLLGLLACLHGSRRDARSASQRQTAEQLLESAVLVTLPRVPTRGNLVR